MKRDKPSAAEWEAHLPEWEEASAKVAKANLERDMAIKNLKSFIDIRNTTLDALLKAGDLLTLRSLEHSIDSHAEQLVLCSARLKLARQKEEALCVRYGYWRNV